jgi:hypothetical protein
VPHGPLPPPTACDSFLLFGCHFIASRYDFD